MAGTQRSTATRTRTTRKKADAPAPETTDAAAPEQAPADDSPTDDVLPPIEGPTGSGAVAIDVTIPEGATTLLADGREMPTAEFEKRLAALSEPFPVSMIEKLPKALIAKDQDKDRCLPGPNGRASRVSADGYHCGGWHPRSMHLDYVGHAGITERLNSVDPEWDYEFQHVDLPQWVSAAVGSLYAQGTAEARAEAQRLVKQHGIPVGRDGGYWITLTVLGITRKGFGDASGKSGPNATKEIIGDAIRNAAMRFGVATYLWSKSDHAAALRTLEDVAPDERPQPEARPALTPDAFNAAVAHALKQQDPAEALRAIGRAQGRAPLDALAVTRKDGSVARAWDVLAELVDAQSPSESRADAPPAQDAPAQDARAQAEDAQPDARAQQDEDARAQAEQEERARAEAEAAERARAEAEAQARAQQEAERARARAAEDARIAQEQERAQAPEKLMRIRLLDEIAGQARTLGRTVDDHVDAFVNNPRAPQGTTLENVDLKPLHIFTRAQRPDVIAALRAQGRASEAEVYERATDDTIDSWARLTGIAQDAAGARVGEPQPV